MSFFVTQIFAILKKKKEIIPAAIPIGEPGSPEVNAQIEGKYILEKIAQRIIELQKSIDDLHQKERLNQGGAKAELQLELQLKQQTAMTQLRQLTLIKRAIKQGGDPLQVVKKIKEDLETKLTKQDEGAKCKTQEDISVTNQVLQWIKEGRIKEGRKGGLGQKLRRLLGGADQGTVSDIIPAAIPIQVPSEKQKPIKDELQIEGKRILKEISRITRELLTSIYKEGENESSQGGVKNETEMVHVRQLASIARAIKQAIKQGGDSLQVVNKIKEDLEEKLTKQDEGAKCKTQEDIWVTNQVLQLIKEGRIKEGRKGLGQNLPSEKPGPGTPPKPMEPRITLYKRFQLLREMFQGGTMPSESPKHPKAQSTNNSRARNLA